MPASTSRTTAPRTTTSRTTAPRATAPRSAASRRRTSSAPLPRAEEIALTADGLAQLTERATALREVALPELRPLLVARERDERVVADFERLSVEAGRLEQIVASATVLPEQSDDVVHLGSRVLIEQPDGERSWVRPVHDAEAFLDDERVSAGSPVSRALLGARAGDVVDVAGPSGTWSCRVVEVVGARSAGARRRRRTAAA